MLFHVGFRCQYHYLFGKTISMMAEHQPVIVKEAQELDRFDDLNIYKKPMPSTILVINYKHGTVDKRKSRKVLKKCGVF